jgi:UDP-2-acetamido-3-amino-2,3-dideoxy-glucuronate N-acetyltransferase
VITLEILVVLKFLKMIHPTSDVQCEKIGQGTTIWQFCVVLRNAVIGKDCNINAHVFIENDVIIGNRVTIKCGVQLWDGVFVDDDVFIGPNVTFTNDKAPRSKIYPEKFGRINILRGASIGANSTILSNVEIGSFALIGAGSIVTRDVTPHSLVIGNPARQIGWVDFKGEKLKKINETEWTNTVGDIWVETANGIRQL